MIINIYMILLMILIYYINIINKRIKIYINNSIIYLNVYYYNHKIV